MAYTSKADLVNAAGGELKLNELADLDGDGEADSTALIAAQLKGDAWINAHLARLNGARLPFADGEVPDLVRLLAADEAIYRLKVARNLNVELDDRLHDDRAKELEALELGKSILAPDTYPVGDGGGTPHVSDRGTGTTGDATRCGAGESRDSMRGVW